MNTSIANTFKSWHKHTNILFFSALLGCFSHSPLQAAIVTTSNGFESGNLSGLSCSGNCPTVSASPVRTGRYAGNFDLRPTMETTYRSEAVLGSKGKFQFGKEYWVEFNYRYEDWVRDSDADIAPFQVHTSPSDWTIECSTRAAVVTAPFLMVTQNDEARFLTYGGKVLWRAPIQKKQWLNMSVHFKISTGTEGFVEAWKDGVYIGKHTGPNSPRLDGCGQPLREPYFKMGVYKWNWKTKITQSSRRQLFIDDLKIMTLN